MFELFLSQFEKVIFKMVSFIFLICVICTVNAQEEILPANPHEFPYQVELKALIHIASGAVLDQVSESILLSNREHFFLPLLETHFDDCLCMFDIRILLGICHSCGWKL